MISKIDKRQKQFGLFRFFICFVVLPILTFQLEDATGDYDKYIQFNWKGALTSHSLTIKTFPFLSTLQKDNLSITLFLYNFGTDNSIQILQSFPLSFFNTQYPVSETQISSLNPKTEYYYAYYFSATQNPDQSTFQQYYTNNKVQEFSFITFALALSPMNFTFGAASCADSGSNSTVFTNLLSENLNFFLHMGDLHYENIDNNSLARFYQGYYKVFNSTTQKPFFQNTPIFYMWDDHDFGPDNSNGNSLSKPAALQTYQEFAPYGPLKGKLPVDDSEAFPDTATKSITDSSQYNFNYQSDDPYGIFRSFIVGRCLFIVMDLRSFKDVITDDILGQEQKVWLENQFIFASVNSQIKFVFLVSTIFWIDNNHEGEWADYPKTQSMIANWTKVYVFNQGKQMMLLSGDTHAMAFDDGRNNYIGEFPVLQAAPLDSFPICSGGPYSHGVSVDRGQYSVIEVTDGTDGNICVKIYLKKLGASLYKYDTCYPNSYPGTEGVSCPKLIVGEAEGYGWLSILVVCGIVGIVVALWILWKCFKMYKKRNADEKEAKLIEMMERHFD